MGDKILLKLTPGELMACQLSLKLIEQRTFELGLIKRGHQHLWNELAKRYGIADKKLRLDYETGIILEMPEPKKLKNSKKETTDVGCDA